MALGKSLEELDRLSSAEIAWWQAYYLVEPFGERWADLRAGKICAVMAECWSTSSRQYTAEDFAITPEARVEEHVQTMEEQQEVAKSITRMLGGVINDVDHSKS